MPTIDYQHDGTEHEYEATTYTLVIYEQEFKSDLIKDVFGRIDINRAKQNYDAEGRPTALDYTMDNWYENLRAFWAMLKTSEAIARSDGRKAEQVPSFVQWCVKTRNVDMQEILQAVFDECNRGLFHSGAADSE